MDILRHTPSEPLKAFVKEYVIIRTSEARDNRVIPDTGMAMTFRLSGEVSYRVGKRAHLVPLASVSGVKRTACTYSYRQDTTNLITIFSEAGFSAFSKVPANELIDTITGSENIFSKNGIVETSERLWAVQSDRDSIQILEQFLLRNLKNRNPDLLVTEALTRIMQRRGQLRIKDLVSSLYCSQDAFEKKFRAKVGISAKQYASIIRFRHLLKNTSSYSSFSETCYEFGYFDQSHFIKDFKQYTGESPSVFFKSSNYW